MSDKENVYIKIEGIQDGVSTKSSLNGIRSVVGAGHVIIAEEMQEGHSTKQIIRIYEDRVEVHKSGYINSKMHFNKDKNHELMYETPYGSMPMTIQTEKLDISEDRSNVYIEYKILSDESCIGNYELRIEIE